MTYAPENPQSTPTFNNNMAARSLAVLGQLEVRLASSLEEIRACQQLRYKVFYEELGAKSGAAACAAGLDEDGFDTLCTHLMVVEGQEVIGTYRLLRQEHVQPHRGFYTQTEFDISEMLAAHPEHRFLELGRSCVLKPWRTKRVIELLWQGIWNFVRVHSLDVMFGCASLEGTDLDALAPQLSFLHHFYRAEETWRAPAREERFVQMDRLPQYELDMRTIFKSLPPLIKGYLRIGARVGDGAVIDHQFNTTDILIVLPVAYIEPRYFSRFGAPDDMSADHKSAAYWSQNQEDQVTAHH